MCNASCIAFFVTNAEREEFIDKRVLEVGSCFVNGSVRPIVEKFLAPREYLGVDIEAGKFVDVVMPAEELVNRFGRESFDVVISTETLEHVADWRLVVTNMKEVLREGGTMYLTTRSFGFRAHSAPYDYWRYEVDDFKSIFREFEIVIVQKDPEAPGVFIKCRKPQRWKPSDLSGIKPYSVLTGKRISEIPRPEDIAPTRRFVRWALETKFRRILPVAIAWRLDKKYDVVPDYV